MRRKKKLKKLRQLLLKLAIIKEANLWHWAVWGTKATDEKEVEKEIDKLTKELK